MKLILDSHKFVFFTCLALAFLASSCSADNNFSSPKMNKSDASPEELVTVSGENRGEKNADSKPELKDGVASPAEIKNEGDTGAKDPLECKDPRDTTVTQQVISSRETSEPHVELISVHQPSESKEITITVLPSSAASVVLVLTSYYGVKWRIVNQGSVKINKVVVSSYDASIEISGTDAQIEKSWSEGPLSYFKSLAKGFGGWIHGFPNTGDSDLFTEIKNRNGVRVNHAQGAYIGCKFTVSSN